MAQPREQLIHNKLWVKGGMKTG